MWVFLSWNMNLEETPMFHLLHHKVQSSLGLGPVIACSAICLWFPALVTSVNYFYGKVISKSLWKYFPHFCSPAVVSVLLMTQHLPILMLLLWCVSKRRMICLKITPYFLLLSNNLLKTPLFLPLPKKKLPLWELRCAGSLGHCW